MTDQESKVLRFNIQRKIVANMTTESWTSIPHVSFVYEPDITRFIEEYRRFDAETPYRVHFNTAMLKALSIGVEAAPQLNAQPHLSCTLRRAGFLLPADPGAGGTASSAFPRCTSI